LTIAAGAPPLAIVSIPPPSNWRALLVLPETPVATAQARAALPQNYMRQDVVASVQNVALLTAAFALGRADLMHLATRDRLHQPYRAELCPLLPVLLPLASSHGVISVTLSGAGPSVMLLTQEAKEEGALQETIQHLVRPLCAVEILPAQLCHKGAQTSLGE
jgi:homoserine kinase